MDKEMNIYLATTWYPRGELPRFTRFLPLLEEVYAGIVISLISSDDQDAMQQFKSGQFSSNSKVTLFVNEDRQRGRYMAIKKALDTPADFIHYADMDRLLHWVEIVPEEWKRMVAKIRNFDCIIFGRTQAAYLTHPQALITTERISNRIVSDILKIDMDVSAGSKSFSRTAAQHIIDNCQTDNSIGTDGEWPICLKQAGFRLEYFEVEGLEWESADQFLIHAANADERVLAARDYDADPKHWARRIEIADEVIQTAIEVSKKRQPISMENISKPLDFDCPAVFDVDDYIYFYSEALTNERTDKEVSALVSLLALDQPKKILDLACGFGRHTNRLAKFGHKMTGVDITLGFLEIARQDAFQKGVNVHYQQDDMRFITFDNEFDCVMLLFTAFGYFSDEENLQVLVNTRNALCAGGLLIFDTNHRDTFLKNMHPFFVVEKEGNLMIDRISFDSLQGRLYNKRIVIRDGVRKDKPNFVRLYNPNEIQALIARAGLILEHTYGGWEAQELSQESQRMVVIARKPESV